MNKQTIIELIGLALENKTEENNQSVPFKVGEKYFIRTATYHLIGEIKEIVGQFIVFEKDTISWVADSGRFMQAIDDGTLEEVEPIKVEGGINMNSIIDYFVWEHKLPREQK